MSARLIPVDSVDLVVFGGTRDVAMRKPLPSLYSLDGDEQLRRQAGSSGSPGESPGERPTPRKSRH